MYSIIFKKEYKLNNNECPFFKDLNLSVIVDAITRQIKDEDLKPIFYTLLNSDDDINYRLDVFNDLKNEDLRVALASFANKLSHIIKEQHKMVAIEKANYADKAILLDLIANYLDIVNKLKEDLDNLNYDSLAIKELHKYIIDLTNSDFFTSMKNDLNNIYDNVKKVDFNLFLNEGFIYVLKPSFMENDFSLEINDLLKPLIDDEELINIKKQDKSLSISIKKSMLKIISDMYPDVFKIIDAFFNDYFDFIDVSLKNFPREFFFYIAYLNFMDRIKNLGLNFCIPTVSTTNKEYEVNDCYDIALAYSFLYTDRQMILNSFYLRDEERTIVISGPNQGGKTTFARMFGQLNYLATIGVPVPGNKAKLFAPDMIYTHFEVEENVIKASGKLNLELERLYEITTNMTSRSVIILNEIFSSTSIADGIVLGKKFLDSLLKADAICVFVTFLDELSKYNKTIVSMVSTVIPSSPELRTLKIIREESNGLAYAMAIAKKYSLDYLDIKRRISHED